MDQLSLAAPCYRLVVDLPECHARESVAVQLGLEPRRVNPLGGECGERESVAHTDIEIIEELACNSRAWIIDGRLRIRNVRGRENPRQSGFQICHVPGPALHRNHGQSASEMGLVALLPAVESFLIDENGQFADSQPVYIRNPEFAHEREEAGLHYAAFYLIASQWIGSVQNHHPDTFLRTGPHHQAESADESVGPGPDILDVINHYVDALQHLLGRLAIFPVDGIHLDSRCSVHRIVHLVPGVGIPADTVLRAEKGHEIDILGLIEYVDCGTEVAVHTARICHKTHTLALKPFKATAFEHLDAGTHLHSRGSIKHCRQECQQNGNQRCSHIFHFLTTLPYSGSTFSRQVTPAVAMQQTITIQKKFT